MTGYSETALIRSMRYLSEAQGSIANNLANVNSTGFKRRIAVAELDQNSFAEMLQRQLPTMLYSERSDWTHGNLIPTGDSMHAAIDGPGYFMVQTAGGQELLTRSGAMARNAAGQLVNDAGHAYLDVQGQKISMPEGDDSEGPITISPDGSIEVGGNAVGQLGVFNAPNPANLAPAGAANYVDTSDSQPTRIAAPNVRQGNLEGSNVDSLTELVQMIGVQRSFDASSRALSSMGRIKSSFISAVNR